MDSQGVRESRLHRFLQRRFTPAHCRASRCRADYHSADWRPPLGPGVADSVWAPTNSCPWSGGRMHLAGVHPGVELLGVGHTQHLLHQEIFFESFCHPQMRFRLSSGVYTRGTEVRTGESDCPGSLSEVEEERGWAPEVRSQTLVLNF